MTAVKKFCGCMSLHTGGFVIGGVTLIGGLLMLTLSSALLHGTLQKDSHPEQAIDLSNDKNLSPAGESQGHATVLSGFYIVMSTLFLISAVLLIYGTLKNRRYFLIPYIVIDGISFLYFGFYFFYQICQDRGQDWFWPGSLIIATITAIEIYFFNRVYELFLVMREERQRVQKAEIPNYSQVPKN